LKSRQDDDDSEPTPEDDMKGALMHAAKKTIISQVNIVVILR
jgi:hypothetical protein